MQVLFTGPRDQVVWNGITFRRNEITQIPEGVNARILTALEGFVVIPDSESVSVQVKRGPGRPKKAAA